jgi:hypothetical protein
MSSEVIQGTLRPDGALELDRKPSLPPGRVQVVLESLTPSTAPGAENRQQPTPPLDNWWQYMECARRELEIPGRRFMNEQEMAAWIEELRREDDRLDQARG